MAIAEHKPCPSMAHDPAETSGEPASQTEYDASATRLRGEMAIEILRNRSSLSGRLDETEVDRVLAYLQNDLEREGDETTPEFLSAMKFFADHGVSLGWLVCGDVADLIVGAAAGSKRAHALSAGGAA